MFNKILIANRGEIACRIIRTAKKLGLQTVAIYSAADTESLHVKLADEAYYVGPAPSSQSYLDAKNIINIAQKSKAEAIHPGYGFLSENAEFAALCDYAGLIFIGPSASAISLMGSKSAAKSLLEKHNIPLIPGFHGDKQDLNTFIFEAQKIGYPILLKAAAGGGGKGMRVVSEEKDLAQALTSAQREAQKSFGDTKILIEKYLKKPRHIEIQIFSDHFKNIVYLFERDCSIQRRHQKVIEEAPAPNLNPDLRKKMGECAIKIAQAIDYVGAGTIEFLLDENHDFYFMEMNTRLQVEHAITEKITGLDLVEWQFKVAAYEPLPLKQEQIQLKGHAIEARIYAEDPYNLFLPATGEIKYLAWPKQTEHVRIDSAVVEKDVISHYYDPMIAKLIVWDETREKAIYLLKKALNDFHLVGVKNNSEFLLQIASHPLFFAADINTNFINQHYEELISTKTPFTDEILVIATLYYLLKQSCKSQLYVNTDNQFSPWFVASHWRMNIKNKQTFIFKFADEEKKIFAELKDNIFIITLAQGKEFFCQGEYKKNSLLTDFIQYKKINTTVYEDDKTLYLFNNLGHFKLTLLNGIENYSLTEEISGGLTAPMPGIVVALMAELGKMVKKGDRLITIEAMKMEHTIQAPADGLIKEIHYKVGDNVNEGAELLTIEETRHAIS